MEPPAAVARLKGKWIRLQICSQ